MSAATVAAGSSTTLNRKQAFRRSLFPSQTINSDSDSDVGHISPINFDSSSDQRDPQILLPKQHQETIGDYDIIGVVENPYGFCTPKGKASQLEFMSPLYISPCCNKITTNLAETPPKISPNFTLKTPHDALNTSSKLPKLSRKSLSDHPDTFSSKRKLSPDTSPTVQIDPKSSRVRTSLFSDDFALSTKSFYSNTEDIMEKIKKKDTNITKPISLFLSKSKNKPIGWKRKIRGTNSGVTHKIRKPKHKNTTRIYKKKITLGVAESAALTEYIKDLKDIKKEPTKLIVTNKENVAPQKLIIPATDFPIKSKKLMPAINSEPTESRKRPVSPESEIDDNNKKKFFKSARSKSVVKMTPSIQVNVDRGKLTLNDKEKCSDDFTDFSMESELPNTAIDNIISSLEEDSHPVNIDNIPPENKIILQTTSSVIASDNSIILHQPKEFNKIHYSSLKSSASLILSPISQMCDVTSGLALNTPKKIKNLTPILEEINQLERTKEQTKLFPVFYPEQQADTTNDKKFSNKFEKKLKKLPKGQMILDAGQKRFGITKCLQCNFVYHMGNANDEISHMEYHNNRFSIRFSGWKNERVVTKLENGDRIIQIIPGDSKIWWKKVTEVMEVVDDELGYFDSPLDKCQVFLYIKKRIIVGCLVAEHRSTAHKRSFGNKIETYSQASYPIKCGILRFWVSLNNRKIGIGTQMVHALKRNFLLGTTLINDDIALGSPTDDGILFAEKYFKMKHFYIYF